MLINISCLLLLFLSTNAFPFSNDVMSNSRMLSVYDNTGRLSKLEFMHASAKVQGYDDLQIHVGPSTLGFGLGLFISVSEDVTAVDLPEGTILCDYSQGELSMRRLGDKCVRYDYSDDPDALVYHQGRVKTVKEAILDLDCLTLAPNRLDGHYVKLDEHTLRIQSNVSTRLSF